MTPSPDKPKFSGKEALALHRRHAWQPFTQMKLTPDPYVIGRAEGVYLYTTEGKSIIDAVGSWWVNVFGHNHPRINNALEAQLHKLEHVMYAGFTHEEALELGGRLSAASGHALPRVFFSDNGSTAVEIGLKMAFQYFVNQGRTEKKEFLTLENGYHGDTIGTMSVGARSVFHEMYLPLLFDVRQARAPFSPASNRGDRKRESESLEEALADLKSVLERYGERICGFILEPLIQGAGGMNIYPALYLKEARRLCDEYEVFLIADEVFVGCGRTGTFFAFEQAEVWPDIMALSKGLAAGYLPFAATTATEKIFQGFYSDDRKHTLFHGHSMTANPLGCAVANAALDLFESENFLEKTRVLEREHEKRLMKLREGKLGARISETRFLGTVGVVELDLKQDYTGDFGWKFWRGCLERGVLLRPIGPVIYLTPPYGISGEELDTVYGVLEETALAVLD